MQPSATGVSKARLEAFSDGVFSLVITLLVLELRLPETLRNDQIVRALIEQWPRVLAYVLSFLSVGVFWVAHHLMLQAAARSDRVLLWINNLFLMLVALVPFAASVLGSYPGARAAVVLYGANLIAVELFPAFAVALRHDIGPAARPGRARFGACRIHPHAGGHRHSRVQRRARLGFSDLGFPRAVLGWFRSPTSCCKAGSTRRIAVHLPQ